MQKPRQISRREFVTTTSAAFVAAQLPGSAADQSAQGHGNLALEGGAKAVPRSLPRPKRWGEPELAQLGEAVKQSSLYYWNNKQTKLLTERFQKVYGHKFVQPCSSGSAALHIAVAAAGIAPGDEVITTSITDIGTVIGVLFQNAVPVFAELERNTYNLDPADVERKITPRTKAIIAVHLMGNPCRLDALKSIAQRHNLILIEDCCQAWGALYQDKPVTSFGNISCFSLQDSKLIACGDGGIVTTSDEQFGPRLIKFGDKGVNRLHPADSSNALGANYRMTELQGVASASVRERVAESGVAFTAGKYDECYNTRSTRRTQRPDRTITPAGGGVAKAQRQQREDARTLMGGGHRVGQGLRGLAGATDFADRLPRLGASGVGD
jgi:hypothetical protein